jgi:hypothetical protein
VRWRGGKRLRGALRARAQCSSAGGRTGGCARVLRVAPRTHARVAPFRPKHTRNGARALLTPALLVPPQRRGAAPLGGAVRRHAPRGGARRGGGVGRGSGARGGGGPRRGGGGRGAWRAHAHARARTHTHATSAAACAGAKRAHCLLLSSFDALTLPRFRCFAFPAPPSCARCSRRSWPPSSLLRRRLRPPPPPLPFRSTGAPLTPSSPTAQAPLRTCPPRASWGGWRRIAWGRSWSGSRRRHARATSALCHVSASMSTLLWAVLTEKSVHSSRAGCVCA